MAPHPSTLGEILDQTANIYRAQFLKFLGIAAPPAAVLLGCMGAMVLLVTMSPGTQRDATTNAVIGLGVLGLMLIAVPLYVAVNGLSSAALSHAGSAAFLDEPITIRDSYRAVWKQGWRYAGLFTLQALAILVGPFLVGIAVFAVLAVMAALPHAGGAMGAAAAAMGLLLGAALGVFALWMLLRLCMAFPVSVVENVSPWAALKRAAALSQGTRWRILVLYVLGAVVGYIVSIVLMVPAMLLAMIPGLATPQKSQLLGTLVIIVFYGIAFAMQTLTRPIYGIAVVLFYYDQRVRREGYDIELLMRQAGMMLEPAPVPAAASFPANPANPSDPSIPAMAPADQTREPA